MYNFLFLKMSVLSRNQFQSFPNHHYLLPQRPSSLLFFFLFSFSAQFHNLLTALPSPHSHHAFPFFAPAIQQTPTFFPLVHHTRCTTSIPPALGEHLPSSSQIRFPCWQLNWLVCSNGRVRRPGWHNGPEGLSTAPSCLVLICSIDCSSGGETKESAIDMSYTHASCFFPPCCLFFHTAS